MLENYSRSALHTFIIKKEMAKGKVFCVYFFDYCLFDTYFIYFTFEREQISLNKSAFFKKWFGLVLSENTNACIYF